MDAEAPSWHEQIFSIDERPVLVLFDGWSSLFRDRVVPWRIGMAEKTRLQFETDTLPRYIETQRWYAAKGTSIERARITDHVVWQEGKHQLAARAAGTRRSAEPARYFMPLALAWEERDEERVRNLSTAAVAKIRQQANVGVMGDAFADEAFCRAVVVAMAKRRDIATAQGKLQFRPTAAFRRTGGKRSRRAPGRSRPQGSSSNTVVVMGERLILKGYRRLRAGASPELEMGLYLTEVVALPELRAAGRRARVQRQRWPDQAARDAAGVRCAIRATAGRIRWNIYVVTSKSIGPSRPAMTCPPMRTRRISSGSAHWRNAPPIAYRVGHAPRKTLLSRRSR